MLHHSGDYASATTGGQVVHESRLELARLLLADFDPDVVDIFAQPCRLVAPADGRVRSHVPDFLLIMRSGTVRVVNVEPAEQAQDPKIAEELSRKARRCRIATHPQGGYHGLGHLDLPTQLSPAMRAVTDGREVLDRLRTIARVAGHDSFPRPPTASTAAGTPLSPPASARSSTGPASASSTGTPAPSHPHPQDATSCEKHNRSCASQTTPNYPRTIRRDVEPGAAVGVAKKLDLTAQQLRLLLEAGL
ncbi:TnsA-like heteromeric transposase endonuclease subunit [Streptomyces sp. SAS_276]|uniref:TnsA-like heteromeric transposase endonuclease subunit n=1 Tax=Streptomyces sp. SAS_276 TaxID=3412745 RepID=UPI00403C2658